ncbi:MAG: hypothetical protein ACAI38_25735 [Myxococcota bacterium]
MKMSGPDRSGIPGGGSSVPSSTLVHLNGVSVDPLKVSGKPGFAPPDAASGQHIVQLTQATAPEFKAQIEKAGGRIVGYFPDNAYLVRMRGDTVKAVKALPFVRATMAMPPQYKLDGEFRARIGIVPDTNPKSVVISTTGNQSLAKVATDMRQLGFTNIRMGHDTVVAEGTRGMIDQASLHDDVLWIGPNTEAGFDLDNIRKLGGADYVSGLANTSGFQGQGMKAHILEGIEKGHPGFAASEHRQAPIVVGGAGAEESSSHGTNTAGEVFGNGAGKPEWKGSVPHAQALYTNASYVMNAPPGSREANSRWAVTKELVEKHDIDGQTASWGYATNSKYDERSRELDGIMADFDLVVTQSQSNTGSPQSRPQAWAKNVIPVTALYHFDNAKFEDDRWNGGSSTRDGADKRIGRTLRGFYDKIGTTAVGGKYTAEFGGTSGATPMTQGLLQSMMQMYKEGVFQSALLNPSSFQMGKRARAATTAALAIATARQMPFASRTAENNRYQQGWGMVDLQKVYDMRGKMLIVNEDIALKPQQTASFTVDVAEGEPELKISMVYKDPPGLVSAGKAQVNDVDIKVTAPDGTVYWGNNGLLDGMYSKSGGEPDRLDTVENVFVEKPKAGQWKIEVIATAINQPIKEGGALEVPFALVAAGGRKV